MVTHSPSETITNPWTLLWETPNQWVDYREILEDLGIPEANIDSDLIDRLQEHFAQYTTSVDAHIALLQERISASWDTLTEKINTLRDWITEQEVITTPETPEGITPETLVARVARARDQTNVWQIITDTVNWVDRSFAASLLRLWNVPFFWWIVKWFTWIICRIFNLENPFDIAEAASDAASEEAAAQAAAEARTRVWEELAGPEGPFARLNIHPVIDAKIRELAQDRELFSEEDIAQLMTMEHIDMRAIQDILWDKYPRLVLSFRNDSEVRAAIHEISVIQSMNDIQESYGISFNAETRTHFREIFEVRFWENAEVVETTFTRFMEWDIVSIWDISYIGAGVIGDTALFFFDIVRAGIIPLSAIALTISEAGIMTLSLPFYALWIGDENAFIAMLENTPEEERRFILASLYRQTWLFTSILASAVYGLSRISLDSTLANWEDFIERLRSTTWNIDWRLAFFQRLEWRFLEHTWRAEWVIQEIQIALGNITKNYQILSIIENAWDDVNWALSNLRNTIPDMNLNFPNGVIPASISDLRGSIQMFPVQSVGTNNLFDNRFWRRFYPGLEHFWVQFWENLSAIAAYQTARIRGRFNTRMLSRLQEAAALFTNHRYGDRLLIETRNPRDALNAMDSLRSIAHDSPGLFRSLFWGIATIGFLWLDISFAEEDTPLLTSIGESLMYMSWIVWPITMIFSAGSSIRDGELTFYNIAEAWAGVAFLALDAVTAARLIATSNGVWDWIIRIGSRLILRPVTDVWHMLPHLARFGVNTYWVITWTRNINIWPTLRHALTGRSLTWLGQAVMRWARTGRGRWQIAAVAGTIAAWAYLFQSNHTPEYQELVDAGVIDGDGNITHDLWIIQNFMEQISQEEKVAFLTILIQSWISEYVAGPEWNYQISLEWQEIVITAAHQMTSWDWLVQPNVASLLSELGYTTRIIPSDVPYETAIV